MKVLAFDTETRGLDWWRKDQRAFLVSWASSISPAAHFHVEHPGGLEDFRLALDWANIIIGHNLGFDIHQLRETCNIDLLAEGKQLVDTANLARVVLPERKIGDGGGYKLKDLATTYVDRAAQDSEQAIIDLAKQAGIKLKDVGGYYDLWRAYPDQLEFYAREDARITLALYHVLMAKLAKDARAQRIWDLEQAVFPILVAAEAKGVAIDQSKVGPLKEQYEDLADTSYTEVVCELGEEALEGTDALKEALLAHGVPLHRETPTGELATNQFALAEFEKDFPVLQHLMDWRTATKFLSTYIEPMVDTDTVHPSFWSMGAWTGRMSCIAEGSFVDAPRNLLLHPRGIPIEAIQAGQYVYSFDEAGVPRAKRVLGKTYQGKKHVLKLVWRARGSRSYLGELKATPDHRVRMASGGYRRMDQLHPGDKLAFLTRSMDRDQRAYLRWDTTERKVYEHQHLVPNAEVVHHINGLKVDNRVENLMAVTRSEHGTLHGGNGRTVPCPYSAEELCELVAGGIRDALRKTGHDYYTFKRWCTELGVIVPDRRLAKVNHEVVMVLSEGEILPTWDLTIEDTPNFIVNEIGVHNCSRPNMQNIPVRAGSEVREVFVPREGNVFVVHDYDSIELKLLAYYLNDSGFKQLVRDGVDVFARLAAVLWGGQESDYLKGTPGQSKRSDAKNTTYAITYGAGKARITDMLGLDPYGIVDGRGGKYPATHPMVVKGWAQEGAPMHEPANQIIKTVKSWLPNYHRLQKRIRNKIETSGYVTTLMGRKQPVNRDKAYVGLNALIQGSAADIFKQGAVLAAEALWHLGFQPVLFVHDELVSEGPAENARAAASAQSASMCLAYNLDPPLEVSGGVVHDNYASAK